MMAKTNVDDDDDDDNVVDQSEITEAHSICVRKICGFCLLFIPFDCHTYGRAIIAFFKLSFSCEAYYLYNLYKSES